MVIILNIYTLFISLMLFSRNNNKQQNAASGASNYCASNPIFLEGQESRDPCTLETKKQVIQN